MTRRLLPALLLVLLAGTLPARAQTAPPVAEITIGVSTEGRPITAVRIGTGPRKFVLVGDTHGGPEANTYELVVQLIAYFREHLAEVPQELSFYLIPTLNPDGLALDSRFNARQVDLNRNMDTAIDRCIDNDWQHMVAGAYGVISDTGGPFPESEVESRLVRDFLLDANAVIFFHSNAGVVFPACEHPPSALLAQVFAGGADYEFIPKWDRYPITGGMHDWAGGLGIPAITPELISGDLPEFEQNLGGVKAILGNVQTLIPEAEAQPIGGVPVHPVLWRAWRAWGAERLWGNPLGPPQPDGHGGWHQLFDNGLLEYHPDRTHTSFVVQVGRLGQEWLGGRIVPPEEAGAGRFFPESGHSITGLFAEFWEIYGGLPIFGLPLTGEEPGLDPAGRPVVTQTFERADLMRPAEAESIAAIQLRPLGRLRWAQADAQTPHSALRPR
jgi:hypothetical protein